MMEYIIIALILIDIIYHYRAHKRRVNLTPVERKIILICLDAAEENVVILNERWPADKVADTLKTLDIIKEKIK